MNRGYSILTIKAIDEESRTITGIATTPETDRQGDIVEPRGAEFSLPIPLLWQHDTGSPIGTVEKARVTKDGIEIVAQIAKNVTADIERAWALIKARLVRGLSVGFRALDTEQIPNSFGLIFKKWEMLEVSAVTIPANAEATITSIKSFDTKHGVVRAYTPGASGNTAASAATPKPKTRGNSMSKLNYSEELKAFEAKRAATVAELDTMLEKSAGASFDKDEQTKYDELEHEVDKIDEHIGVLKRAVARQAKEATPVTRVDPGEGGEAARTAAERSRAGGERIVATEPKREKGIMFARFAGALAHTKGNYNDAAQYIKGKFPEDKKLASLVESMQQFGGPSGMVEVMKTAVAAGTTIGSTGWADPLVQYRDMVSDFIEYLRPMTIIGKLPLVPVPFNIRIPRQTSGGSAYWTKEGNAKPVTNLAFDNITLKWFKLATIAVITQELARFSSPAAEGLIRDALAKAIAYQADLDFIDPDNAGTADTKPASILSGVTPIHTSGTNEAALNADIAKVFAPFIAANMSPETGYWIMTPVQALKISLMKNSLGQLAFPGVTLNGGTFNGMPLITSNALADAEGSSGGAPIVLVDAKSVLLADDGEATIDVSTQASVQMNDAPDNPASASTVYTSLWQNNLVGIRAERYINWAKTRSQAAQWINGANYG